MLLSSIEIKPSLSPVDADTGEGFDPVTLDADAPRYPSLYQLIHLLILRGTFSNPQNWCGHTHSSLKLRKKLSIKPFCSGV